MWEARDVTHILVAGSGRITPLSLFPRSTACVNLKSKTVLFMHFFILRIAHWQQNNLTKKGCKSLLRERKKDEKVKWRWVHQNNHQKLLQRCLRSSVIGRGNTNKERLLDFASESNERILVSVNSFSRGLDSKGLSLSKESGAARPCYRFVFWIWERFW